MKNYYAWVSDLSENSGEGQLARLFLNDLYSIKKKKISCYTNNGKYIFSNNQITTSVKKHKNNLLNNYIKVFYGIILLWIFYFKGRKIIYLNYLPLWNFLIFILIPPRTILGPVTGNIKKKGSFLRNYILKYMCLISVFILNLRKKNFIFAHEDIYYILKNYLNKNTLYNYQLSYVKKSYISNIKKNNIIIYNRKNKSKNLEHLISKTLKQLKFENIYVIGEKLNYPDVENFGYISKKNIENILKKSKFALISDENLYSFFTMDALKYGLMIIYNSERYIVKNYFINSKFISISKIKSMVHNLEPIRKTIFLKKDIKDNILLKFFNYLKFV
jgi:hypothetical protein